MNKTALFLFLSISLVSQTLLAQVKFGVKGGLNIAKVITTNSEWDKNY